MLFTTNNKFVKMSYVFCIGGKGGGKSGVSSGLYRQTDCGLTADIQWNCHRRRKDTMRMLQSADNFLAKSAFPYSWVNSPSLFSPRGAAKFNCPLSLS